jgi:hypothetical protein
MQRYGTNQQQPESGTQFTQNRMTGAECQVFHCDGLASRGSDVRCWLLKWGPVGSIGVDPDTLSAVMVPLFEPIFHSLKEYLRLFNVGQMTAVFKDDKLGMRNTLVNNVRLRWWADEIVATDQD